MISKYSAYRSSWVSLSLLLATLLTGPDHWFGSKAFWLGQFDRGEEWYEGGGGSSWAWCPLWGPCTMLMAGVCVVCKQLPTIMSTHHQFLSALIIQFLPSWRSSDLKLTPAQTFLNPRHVLSLLRNNLSGREDQRKPSPRASCQVCAFLGSYSPLTYFPN